MAFEKNGMITQDSHSDFNMTKKAKYYDELGTGIADEENKDKLNRPALIPEIEPIPRKNKI